MNRRHPFPFKPSSMAIAFFASALQAFGLYNVHSLSGVTEGGVLGLTLLLDHWLGLSPAISSLLLNVACFALGVKGLGKSFAVYSCFAFLGFSAGYGLCQQFPPLWPGLGAYPPVAAVVGALFIGIGAGLCVRAGGATTGDDALAMSLAHWTNVPIQWIYLCSDLTVLLLSLTYIPAKRLVWSLVSVILSGQIIGLLQPRRPAKRA